MINSPDMNNPSRIGFMAGRHLVHPNHKFNLIRTMLNTDNSQPMSSGAGAIHPLAMRALQMLKPGAGPNGPMSGIQHMQGGY